MASTKKTWFQTALQLKGSVVPAILPRVILCGIWAELLAILYRQGLPVHQPVLSNIVPALVLGLLLVFRTNTAYDRYWEGRRSWGAINSAIKNLSRQMLVAITEKAPNDRREKEKAIRLLIAFVFAMKQYLRQESIKQEVESYVSPHQFEILQQMNNPPLEIILWVSYYLNQQNKQGKLDIYQLNSMNQFLNTLIESLGACERILKTPIPLAYSIHLKQLLVLYCFSLPFQLVKELNLWTGFVVVLISFAIFGIEEIGIEIENPFGRDPNDLPLDSMCNGMRQMVEDLLAVSALNLSQAINFDKLEETNHI